MEAKTKTSIILVISYLPGLFLVISGLLLIFAPTTADALFGHKGMSSIDDNSLAASLGVRQLAIGLMIVILAIFRQVKALGLIMIVGSIVPLVDFIAFYPIAGLLSTMRHVVVFPIVLVFGIYLLILEKANKHGRVKRKSK